MKTRFGFTFALTACAVIGLTGVAAAQPVVLVGCPYHGPGPGCILMKGSSGLTYLVSSAQPKVPINTIVIRLSGFVSGAPNICFARALTKITWTKTRKRCPTATINPKL